MNEKETGCWLSCLWYKERVGWRVVSVDALAVLLIKGVTQRNTNVQWQTVAMM